MYACALLMAFQRYKLCLVRMHVNFVCWNTVVLLIFYQPSHIASTIRTHPVVGANVNRCPVIELGLGLTIDRMVILDSEVNKICRVDIRLGVQYT